MSDGPVAQRSFISRVALPVFSWGLPFHSLLVAALFGGLGLSATLVRGIAAWKEAAVLALLAFVTVRALVGRGPRIRLSWVDIAVGSLLALAGMSFIAAGPWLRLDLPAGATIYGLRDMAFFLLLYFVGRACPEIIDDPNTMRRLYIITVLVSAIAIVEWLFATPETLVLLGVASYFQDFLNVAAFTEGNEYGLPMNYWTQIGGTHMQRAGSVYLSSQGFAVPFLILIPIATAWVFGGINRITASMRVEYAIIWIGLLLSITRMTVVVCTIQILLMVLMFRRPAWAVGGMVSAAVSLVLAMLVVPGLAGFVWDTLTWQTGSSVSHSKDWSLGINALIERPWGAGLGTTDQTAIRFGLEPLTADNAYLKYAVELGVQGLIAYLAVFVGIALASLRAYSFGSTPLRRILGAAVFATTVGIVLNAATGVVFNALVLSYFFFWFAGAIVTVAQADAAARRVRVPELRPALSAAG